MTDKLKYSNYIRYALSQLRAKNKHHEFEELARQFTRQRLCSNVIPATGPVAAGGDQGRDYESFKTFIKETGIEKSTFIGLASVGKVVGATSLQQDDIGTKIKSDVNTICGAPDTIEHIYFFAEVNIPTAKRHELQDWCLKTHNSGLDIFDGNGLADQLSDSDLYWICDKFLEIPQELFPETFVSNDFYSKCKLRCFETGFRPQSYFDFSQIKCGLRTSTFSDEFKPDISLWLTLMETFLESPRNELWLKAAYEISVAELRGKNNLNSKVELVREYFSKHAEWTTLALQQDAVCLLTYCVTAEKKGDFNYERSDLIVTRDILISSIERDLAQKDLTSSIKCKLYEMRGQIGIVEALSDDSGSFEVDSVLEWWSKLIADAPNAINYPLEPFSDLLTQMIPLLSESDKFNQLCMRTDEELDKRSSGYLSAEKCYDRARGFIKLEKYVEAIEHLQTSKINWFNADTMVPSLRVMIAIAHCYQEAGLFYAAKYYLLGVLHICLAEDAIEIRSLAPIAQSSLCDFSYEAGDWISFLYALRFSETLQVDLGDPDNRGIADRSIDRNFTNACLMRACLQNIGPAHLTLIDEIYEKIGLEEISDIFDELKHTRLKDLVEMDENDTWENVNQGFLNRPLNELGERRNIRWQALGIEWLFSFENTYDLNLIAEELVSVLQIVLIEISKIDFLLLPTETEIQISFSEADTIQISEQPSNEKIQFELLVPNRWLDPNSDRDELISEVLSTAITIIAQCSLLPDEELVKNTEKLLESKIKLKAFNVGRYSVLFQHYLPVSVFGSLNLTQNNALRPDLTYDCKDNAILKWNNANGFGYSKMKSEEFLKNRYENVASRLQVVLPELLKNDWFRNVVDQLKAGGYLDWQILNIFLSIIISGKSGLLDNSASIASGKKNATEILASDEAIDLPINKDWFSENIVEQIQNTALISILNTWGLQTRSQTPKLRAIKKLLDERYHNSTDDIKHEKLWN